MGIREKLIKTYFKIQSVIIPFFRYPQDIYENILKAHVNSEITWLDIGCGHNLLQPWRYQEEKKLINGCKTIIGIDYSLLSLKKHKTIHKKVRGDASLLPFKENSFDLITANMVVEHFYAPEIQIKEIHRILKPGGLFIFHTPNIFGYVIMMAKLVPERIKKKLIYILEGRNEEDVFPTYYKANSESQIRELAESIGFNVLEIRMLVSSAKSSVIPPIAAIELLLIRMLMARPFKKLRANIIATLQKKPLI